MKKYIITNENYTTDDGWTFSVIGYTNTKAEAETICEKKFVEETITFLRNDIDMGADEEVVESLIAELQKGLKSFKDSETVDNLMFQGDYDWGLNGSYSFGYGGNDGDNWTVSYEIYEAEEVK